jgi:hypothetical protein
MFERTRVSSCLAGAALAASLAACGGSSSGPTSGSSPTPTPVPQPTPQVLSQMSGLSVPVNYAYGIYFDTTATGTIDVTVDYTFANSNLAVWVASGRCTADQFGNNQCPFLATSLSGAKPRKISLPNQVAGSYTLIAGNFGPQEEAISYQVVFTRSATAGSAPSASSRLALEPGFLARLP